MKQTAHTFGLFRKVYEKPTAHILVIEPQKHLLAGSGPSATFMSNPGISDTDDDDE